MGVCHHEVCLSVCLSIVSDSVSNLSCLLPVTLSAFFMIISSLSLSCFEIFPLQQTAKSKIHGKNGNILRLTLLLTRLLYNTINMYLSEQINGWRDSLYDTEYVTNTGATFVILNTHAKIIWLHL